MRIQSIDTFKGLAILMVVVIHTEPFLAIPAIKANWYYLGHALQQISSFAVPFFFAAAGYFFSIGIDKEDVLDRWRKYTSRLSVLLLIWIVIDGIFWGQWLEKVIESGSLSPLLWNLNAIPSFASKRPDLFFLRGTAVPLWFLISLILSIGILTLYIRLSLQPITMLLIGFCSYAFSLAVSSYSNTRLGIGLSLPLEQRGPFIALAFLTMGHFFAVRKVQAKRSELIFTIAILLVFLETFMLSHFTGLPFQERPYLFSTVALAASGLLFALHNPTFGASSLISKIGSRSLGVYLIHTPVLGAVGITRDLFVHPIWEAFFPCLVLALSFFIVSLLLKIPHIRFFIQ